MLRIFPPQEPFPLCQESTYSIICSGDIDGDGYDELVLLNSLDRYLTVTRPRARNDVSSQRLRFTGDHERHWFALSTLPCVLIKREYLVLLSSDGHLTILSCSDFEGTEGSITAQVIVNSTLFKCSNCTSMATGTLSDTDISVVTIASRVDIKVFQVHLDSDGRTSLLYNFPTDVGVNSIDICIGKFLCIGFNSGIVSVYHMSYSKGLAGINNPVDDGETSIGAEAFFKLEEVEILQHPPLPRTTSTFGKPIVRALSRSLRLGSVNPYPTCLGLFFAVAWSDGRICFCRIHSRILGDAVDNMEVIDNARKEVSEAVEEDVIRMPESNEDRDTVDETESVRQSSPSAAVEIPGESNMGDMDWGDFTLTDSTLEDSTPLLAQNNYHAQDGLEKLSPWQWSVLSCVQTGEELAWLDFFNIPLHELHHSLERQPSSSLSLEEDSANVSDSETITRPLPPCVAISLSGNGFICIADITLDSTDPGVPAYIKKVGEDMLALGESASSSQSVSGNHVDVSATLMEGKGLGSGHGARLGNGDGEATLEEQQDQFTAESDSQNIWEWKEGAVGGAVGGRYSGGSSKLVRYSQTAEGYDDSTEQPLQAQSYLSALMGVGRKSYKSVLLQHMATVTGTGSTSLSASAVGATQETAVGAVGAADVVIVAGVAGVADVAGAICRAGVAATAVSGAGAVGAELVTNEYEYEGATEAAIADEVAVANQRAVGEELALATGVAVPVLEDESGENGSAAVEEGGRERGGGRVLEGTNALISLVELVGAVPSRDGEVEALTHRVLLLDEPVAVRQNLSDDGAQQQEHQQGQRDSSSGAPPDSDKRYFSVGYGPITMRETVFVFNTILSMDRAPLLGFCCFPIVPLQDKCPPRQNTAMQEDSDEAGKGPYRIPLEHSKNDRKEDWEEAVDKAFKRGQKLAALKTADSADDGDAAATEPRVDDGPAAANPIPRELSQANQNPTELLQPSSTPSSAAPSSYAAPWSWSSCNTVEQAICFLDVYGRTIVIPRIMNSLAGAASPTIPYRTMPSSVVAIAEQLVDTAAADCQKLAVLPRAVQTALMASLDCEQNCGTIAAHDSDASPVKGLLSSLLALSKQELLDACEEAITRLKRRQRERAEKKNKKETQANEMETGTETGTVTTREGAVDGGEAPFSPVKRAAIGGAAGLPAPLSPLSSPPSSPTKAVERYAFDRMVP